jgi:hypothetical protein
MVEPGDRVQGEPRTRVGAGDVLSSLQIVCAWCQQHLGWHRVQTPLPFQTSYSICPACLGHLLRELRVRRPALPQTADEPYTACRDGHAEERSRAPRSADTPPASVPEASQPARQEALLPEVCDTHLDAQVLRAAARAARQRATEVQRETHHTLMLSFALYQESLRLIAQLYHRTSCAASASHKTRRSPASDTKFGHRLRGTFGASFSAGCQYPSVAGTMSWQSGRTS